MMIGVDLFMDSAAPGVSAHIARSHDYSDSHQGTHSDYSFGKRGLSNSPVGRRAADSRRGYLAYRMCTVCLRR